MAAELLLEHRTAENGRSIITAWVGNAAVLTQRIDAADPAAREAFVQELYSRCAGVDVDQLRTEMEQIAGKSGTDARSQSQATLLVELAAAAELFRTPGTDGQAFALVPSGGCGAVMPVPGIRFKRWLRHQFYKRYHVAPSEQAVAGAAETLASRAVFEGPEHPVWVRVAAHQSATYLDLADDQGRMVKIDSDGWSVVTSAPVRFVRRSLMLPLPVPESGGSVAELREFVNVRDDAAWSLLLCWLIYSLRPVGPFPLLLISGQQGSAKSTLTKLLKLLLDPSRPAVRAEPTHARDLMIAAQNSWVLALDNLSSLPPWLSDGLCRLSTGGGMATRQLYSDDDEKLFDVMRPAVLNGIDSIVGRSDLLDRCVTVRLRPIPPTHRRPESTLLPAFDRARPRILGALLDAHAAALRRLPDVRERELPRMADFAMFAAAGEQALGLPAGSFLAAYQDNREEANTDAIEASAVAVAVQKLLAEREEWEGTMKELLDALSGQPITDQTTRRKKDWPQGPRKLSADLDRVAPNLLQAGIEVDCESRSNRGRIVTLKKKEGS
jgi:hypothetical protein